MYLLRRENAPLRPRIILLLLNILAFSLFILSPIIASDVKVSDKTVAYYNLSVLTLSLSLLSGVSIYYLVRLNSDEWFKHDQF